MSVVFKAIELPGQEFASKEEMIAAVVKNKSEIMQLKKAELKYTDSIEFKYINPKSEAIKGIEVPEGFIFAVINTTKYLDSHNDLHINGIWNKSIKEQQGNVFYVADHSLSVLHVISFPKDVEMLLMEIPWKDLGAEFDGNTQGLIFKVEENKIRLKEAKEIIEEKIDIQHSVRMRYIKVDLAVDSSSEDFAEEKALWDNTIGMVANKEVAINRGYYWVVAEAEVFKEGSMVLAGSNDITPMILSKQEIEPGPPTHKKESEETPDPKPDEKDSFDITQYLY